MQGLPTPRSPAPLNALFDACLPWPALELRVRWLTWGYLIFQAFLMLVVRLSDDTEAFLEGAAARGWTVLLLIRFFPLALALARGGGSVDDAWARALAELRGYSSPVIVQSSRMAPVRALRGLLVPAGLALMLWPTLLLLGESPGRFVLRLGVLLLLGLVSAVAALGLLGLGGVLGRHLPAPRAPWALLLLVWGPWVVGGIAEFPALSLPGLFRAGLGLVLGLAPS